MDLEISCSLLGGNLHKMSIKPYFVAGLMDHINSKQWAGQLVGLELNDPVNTVTVMSSRFVCLTILLLGRLSLLSSICAHSFARN